jgi:hypothetical protein
MAALKGALQISHLKPSNAPTQNVSVDPCVGVHAVIE